MKKLTVMALSLCFSTMAFAVPAGMKLISPTKIEVKSAKLNLTVALPCKNENALDWSNVVMTSDDEGDQAASVGVVYSTDTCETSDTLRDYTITLNPKKYGYPTSSTMDYVPMDLAK